MGRHINEEFKELIQERDEKGILKMIDEHSLEKLKQVAIDEIPVLDFFVIDENINIVKKMIEKGFDVNQTRFGIHNLLYYTVTNAEGVTDIRGKTEMLLCLIENGINVNFLGHGIDNFTALMWTGVYRNWEQAKILIENGADPYLVSEEGTPFITYVIHCGDEECITYFLERDGLFQEEEKKQLKARRLELLYK